MKFSKIAFIASDSKDAQKALKELSKIYKNITVEKADIIVALGGDGQLLNVIEVYGKKNIRCPRKACSGHIRNTLVSNRSTFYCPVCQI